jgi:hypothetical protein
MGKDKAVSQFVRVIVTEIQTALLGLNALKETVIRPYLDALEVEIKIGTIATILRIFAMLAVVVKDFKRARATATSIQTAQEI